jgi:hypothetical protein
MTILSNGNIGIGTTSPGYKLDVNGDVNISGNLSGTLYADTLDYNFYNVAMWGDSYTYNLSTILPTTLTDKSVYVYGVSGETSTQIASRMIAASNTHDFITIIWAGRNNHDSVATVEADIASMVAALGTNSNFLILSVLNGEIVDEYLGGSSYTNIIAINDYLATTYPNNYYDIRSYLVSQYDPNVPQDVIDLGHDIVPSSLRGSSTIHPNAVGSQLVANQIQTFINSHFVPVIKKPLSYIDIPTIFSNPPPFGQITLSSGSKIVMNTMPLLQASTTLDNYFFGGAGNLTTTGTQNSAMGYQSLRANTTGSNNSAMGYMSLYNNTTGSSNSAVGHYSFYNNTTGSNNSAVGGRALFANTGSSNSAMGYMSLYNNTTGSNNSAMGNVSLYNNTTGSYNSAMGDTSLQSNTTGARNSAVGMYSLQFNTTGGNNSAVGMYSLRYNTTGTYNSATGFNSLYNNKSATSTVALGAYAAQGSAFYSNQYGTYVGYKSGYNVQTGSDNNTFLGYQSGLANTTGANNLLLGYQAGDNITTGSNNIVIGYDVNATSTDSVNFLNIGNTIYGNTGTGMVGIGTTSPYSLLSISNSATTAANTPLFSIASTTNGTATTTVFSVASTGDVTINGSSGSTCTIGNGTNGTSCTSDEQLKTNITVIPDALHNIEQIKGVTFNWADQTKNQNQFIGVIAQDVQKVFPQAVATLSNGYLAVDYGALVAPLIEAVKELAGKVNLLAATVAGFAQSFTSENITATHELCVEGTCITGSQLQQLLQNSGQQATPPTVHDELVEPTADEADNSDTATSTDSVIIDDTQSTTTPDTATSTDTI